LPAARAPRPNAGTQGGGRLGAGAGRLTRRQHSLIRALHDERQVEHEHGAQPHGGRQHVVGVQQEQVLGQLGRVIIAERQPPGRRWARARGKAVRPRCVKALLPILAQRLQLQHMVGASVQRIDAAQLHAGAGAG